MNAEVGGAGEFDGRIGVEAHPGFHDAGIDVADGVGIQQVLFADGPTQFGHHSGKAPATWQDDFGAGPDVDPGGLGFIDLGDGIDCGEVGHFEDTVVSDIFAGASMDAEDGSSDGSAEFGEGGFGAGEFEGGAGAGDIGMGEGDVDLADFGDGSGVVASGIEVCLGDAEFGVAQVVFRAGGSAGFGEMTEAEEFALGTGDPGFLALDAGEGRIDFAGACAGEDLFEATFDVGELCGGLVDGGVTAWEVAEACEEGAGGHGLALGDEEFGDRDVAHGFGLGEAADAGCGFDATQATDILGLAGAGWVGGRVGGWGGDGGSGIGAGVEGPGDGSAAEEEGDAAQGESGGEIHWVTLRRDEGRGERVRGLVEAVVGRLGLRREDRGGGGARRLRMIFMASATWAAGGWGRLKMLQNHRASPTAKATRALPGGMPSFAMPAKSSR